MISRRTEKINSLLRNLATSFFRKETKETIVTVTRVETFRDLKSAKIFISIFSENRENETLDFLKKKTGELRRYVGSQIKWKFLPRLEIEMDKGEKSRQKIEKILGLVGKQ